MLVTVLLSIGPLGHNQAMTVWPTNVYLDCLAVFLFMHRRPLFGRDSLRQPLAALGIVLFMLLPALGMAERLGPHPAFKLYCCLHMGELRLAPGEDISFLPPRLEEKAAKDGRLPSSLITFDSFEVCSGTFLPGDRAYLDAMKGFCPHLKKPAEARIRIIEATHFWSDAVTVREYGACAPLQPDEGKNGAIDAD